MISIIVPIYNIENYLPVCVESLLKQSREDLEILLVDDGSTDGSGALCDAYARRDARVRVIHKANGGLSDARNAGLDAARGQWLLFVDGDDYLVPDAVERLVPLAEPDLDFIQFLYRETDGSWLPENQSANPRICENQREMFEKLYEMGGVYASSCTKLWNRRVFEGLRFQRGTLHEDEELLNRALPRCRKVVYTDLVLYGYVMRAGSIIHSAFRPKQMDVFPIMERRTAVLEELGLDALARQTRGRMFQTALWQYCLARRNGFSAEAAGLKRRILELADMSDLPMTGQYRMVYRLAGKFPAAVELYYFVRRLVGKT